jgi:hypothetical protein
MGREMKRRTPRVVKTKKARKMMRHKRNYPELRNHFRTVPYPTAKPEDPAPLWYAEKPEDWDENEA